MLTRTHEMLGHEADMQQHEGEDPAVAAEREGVDDDVLRLIFIACHPVLPREARTALTLKMVAGLSTAEIARLFEAIRSSLTMWTERLRAEAAGKFPENVTAFRDGMAVHGRYKLPCPRCGTKIQRIRYAANETNYCPTCQTGGKLLADRALSRLLREDWPRTIEELELLTSKPK